MKRCIVLILTLALIVSSFAGCSSSGSNDANNNSTNGAGQTDDKTDDKTGTETDIVKEAPMLAEQVAAGTLPALEDRLPAADDVMIEPDVMSLGEYGGSISIVTNDSGRWGWGPYTEQSMFRFKQDGTGEVEPNVCKNFYSNEDSTVWTIELREGMKWSDGAPFTADDVIFYYDHCSVPALNDDRSAVSVDDPNYYSCFTSKPYNCYQVAVDGVKYWAEFEKIDDYKFTVTFKAPKPAFPVEVAVDNKWMFLPKHFYIDYVSRKDGVTDDPDFPFITEEQAVANANKMFNKQWESYSTMGKDVGYYNWDYAAVPQLRSFIAVKDNWNRVGETYELVRNPYFFKTDSEGRQLPYLDSIKVSIINENEQVVLKSSAGDFDLMTVADADFAMVATSTMETHNIANWFTANWGAEYVMALNQTAKDLDKRALFQDKRFREALSISVDRNLLNATLMNGQSAPGQCSVQEGAAGYDEEWTNKWTEYDVERANSLLDELTEPWDRQEGTYRKMKGTNKDLEIIVTVRDTSYGDFITLMASAYKAIGIKLSDKVDADDTKAKLNNDVEASIERPSVSTPAIRPDDIVPMRNFKGWCGAYGKWYEDGKSEANGGIAPTGDILELINAYEAIKSASGSDRQAVVDENVQKIYDLHKENIWIIGFLKDLPLKWIVNKNLKNFPESVMYVDEFRFASMMRPEQLYWEQ